MVELTTYSSVSRSRNSFDPFADQASLNVEDLFCDSTMVDTATSLPDLALNDDLNSNKSRMSISARIGARRNLTYGDDDVSREVEIVKIAQKKYEKRRLKKERDAGFADSLNTPNVSQDDGLVRLVNVGVTYKSKRSETRAVNGVSLLVQPGEVFSLLGVNGAGKTSLINAMSGLLTPSTGKIYVGGVEVQEHPEIAAKMIGINLIFLKIYLRIVPTIRYIV